MSDFEESNGQREDDEEDEEIFDVEYIFGKRTVRGKIEYHVKWLNYHIEESSWEPAENLDCPEKITEYEVEIANENMKKMENAKQRNKSQPTGSSLNHPNKKVPKRSKKVTNENNSQKRRRSSNIGKPNPQPKCFNSVFKFRGQTHFVLNDSDGKSTVLTLDQIKRKNFSGMAIDYLESLILRPENNSSK